VFLDQHHPNLFFTDQLSEIFENPIFIYPSRPIYQVVASMMRHGGVMRWFQFARKGFSEKTDIEQIHLPNRFLGISKKEELFELEPHKLCALRVLAHYYEMKKLIPSDSRYRFLSYENLVTDQKEEYNSIFTELEIKTLGGFDVVEEGKVASIKKYRSTLSEKQVEDIVELERQWQVALTPHS